MNYPFLTKIESGMYQSFPPLKPEDKQYHQLYALSHEDAMMKTYFKVDDINLQDEVEMKLIAIPIFYYDTLDELLQQSFELKNTSKHQNIFRMVLYIDPWIFEISPQASVVVPKMATGAFRRICKTTSYTVSFNESRLVLLKRIIPLIININSQPDRVYHRFNLNTGHLIENILSDMGISLPPDNVFGTALRKQIKVGYLPMALSPPYHTSFQNLLVACKKKPNERFILKSSEDVDALKLLFDKEAPRSFDLDFADESMYIRMIDRLFTWFT
eukprot:CAMPEP_0117421474 /NCGR_PEP_ID=MMETSP0758-20121206/2553_1 /TAXON_ID=63605 /ORGANISM="Percolomonas cosmopolitus, Strain AE-1 (ATCC 50343)" /LENGTH=271 /DNA_ID=CAMNT_0005203609 /DNA_START=228 /DNA_END=1043 /DNA_ORIENTATION=+